MLHIEPVECESDFSFYHKGGNGKARNRERMESQRVEKRLSVPVIAWDGEGIDLRGPGRPQSYVLFGCSAEVDSPLIINSPDQCLDYRQIVDYICDVGSRNPGAIHVGYGFGYDQNMIIQKMPLDWKILLKEGKAVVYYDGPHRKIKYRVKINWQKRIEVTRTRFNDKVTVRIDDIASFFHAPFTEAYRTIVGSSANQTVVSGKAARGNNEFSDLPEILSYWQAEIVALAELGDRFRSIMYNGGFLLTDWYGPGAVASYMRRTEKLSIHEWGAKESNIPGPVHKAAKSAFYGGRFEQFQIGRLEGPIYSLDINSAYPAAFCDIPTLKEGGFWDHVEIPSNNHCFGVYYLRFCDPEWTITDYGVPRRSLPFQPLPHRNRDGQISYPSVVEGWYWRPEMEAVRDCFPDYLEIVEGWEWRPAADEYPWRELMTRMFAARKALKAVGDPTQMAYKLAINSLYGKMAQRVGWNKETKTPPKSHSLAIAGYITSHCRASLVRVMSQLSPDQLIAVETDGIYTTADPAHLHLISGIGSELGQWELEQYDEMLYVQNGVYLARNSQEWVKAKSRGFSSKLVTPESMQSFLQSLTANGYWDPMEMPPVSKFIGIGLALQLGRNSRNTVNPSKVNSLHCQWIREDRQIDAKGRGKRVHVPGFCDRCADGFNTYERPHVLYSNHGNHGAILKYATSYANGERPVWHSASADYKLPWETAEVENWRELQEADDELLEREYVEINASLYDAL